MSEIKKMKRYIERTNMKKGHSFQMNIRETLELAHAAKETPVDIICLAFDYGRVKGYRLAHTVSKENAP